MKKIVVVFSGNRAEYGLLKPVINELKKSRNFDYKLIISGAHLDRDYGFTINEIKKDGFKIFKKVLVKKYISNDNYTPLSISNIVKKLSTILINIKPHFFMVYADRFEAFAATIASSQMSIPTVHLEGGDITEGGALDDSVRHAVTKLSHIHFTSNSKARNKIISMGEEKWRVRNVGFTAIDNLSKKNYAKEIELINKFNLNHTKPIVLFTQHSVTTEYKLSKLQIKESIKAICKLALEDINLIITYPNNDIGGKIIIKELKKLENKKLKNIQLHNSLGSYYYHGILGLSKNKKWKIVCAGNSSSGIKETPFFSCPTVNIGTRQKGRLRGKNVIDSDYNSKKIYSAIKKAIYNKEFLAKCKKSSNPYGGGSAGKKIVSYLSSIEYNKIKILRKKN